MGTHANEFFISQLSRMKKGKMLLPGEGEGRNAIAAAKLGWSVDAFDISEKGRDIALKSAAAQHVSLRYWIADLKDLHLTPDTYDVIAMIDVYTPPLTRQAGLCELSKALKPGGVFILECFSPENVKLKNFVGPGVLSWLFTPGQLKRELPKLVFDLLEVKSITRHEVKDFPAVVVQCVAHKPKR